MTKTPRRTRSLSRLETLNQMLLSDTLDVGVFMDNVSAEIRGLTSCPKSAIWIVGGGKLSIRTDVALCDGPIVRSINIESLRPEVRNTILSKHPVELVGGDRVAHHAVDSGYVQATGIHYMYRRPVFDRGEGVRAEARARAGRLTQELDARRRAVRIEVRAAFEIYDQQRSAVEELERDALGVVEENETLSKESYDVGQISLIELLLVRRQMLEIRSDYLSRLLDAAIASADLEASAGVSP